MTPAIPEPGQPVETRPALHPRGAAAEAITTMLRRQPGRAFTIAQLTAALAAEGQPTPGPTAIRTTVYALIRDGAAREALASYPRRYTAAATDPATVTPRRRRHTFPPGDGPAPDTVIDRVYQHLVHHAGRRPLTATEIRRRVGADARSVHSALTRLCAEGNVHAAGRPRRYTATP